jgi:hypothetical protein
MSTKAKTSELRKGDRVIVGERELEVVAVSRWASNALTFDVILADAAGKRYAMIKPASAKFVRA